MRSKEIAAIQDEIDTFPMRFLTSLFCLFLLSGVAAAQKRYLVSPNQEVMPLPPGQTPERVINKYMKRKAEANASASCGQAQFGYYPDRFSSTLGFTHKTTLGQWFVVPATGTIDTVYFYCTRVGPSWAIMDSTVYLRIFQSYITPTAGPGAFPGPYPSPCRGWGYWLNVNDQDQGVAAFREDATDTTWHSTIETNGGTTPSYPPFGPTAWGASGYPVKLRYGVNTVPLPALGILSVTRGDVLFFTLRMNSPALHVDDHLSSNWTAFEISSLNTSKPARDWKFYEHDSGPSNCAGFPSAQIKRGWVARGAPSGDTSAAAAFNVWYDMTPTSNTPPSVGPIELIRSTLSTGPQSGTVQLTDCDAEVPPRAGVKTALVRYTFKNFLGATLSVGTNPMSYLGFDQFQFTIPGAPIGTFVSYTLVFFDSTGLGDSTAGYNYRVLDLNSAYYRMDTSLACTAGSIAGSGTLIDTSAYFQVRGKHDARGDDGTAGPFSLGGPFIYFGDTLYYAWIGVNGGIALSKNATDTLDVNANGFATGSFDFPQRQYHSRADTMNQRAGYMPKNFIAPFWADWIVYQDTPSSTFGAIRYSSTAYPGKFIAEWDGVGAFFVGGPQPDIDTFRVVLDRASGTIQFQYPNIGTNGLDTNNLTGLSSDSISHPGPITPFNYFNRNGAPAETHLRNGLCVSYYPVVYTTALEDGWNMVSIGETAPSYAKSFLFPTATSNAFMYSPSAGGYKVTTPLDNGHGFWLKFSGAQLLDAPGSSLSHVDVALTTHWNLVGSVSKSVSSASLTTSPSSLLTSPLFGFTGGGYHTSPTLDPGRSYWVRSTGPGTLHIVATGAEPKAAPANQELAGLNRLTVQDKIGRAQTLYIGSESVLSSQAAVGYELPPPGPEGSLDVRFTSQRMVEVHPTQIDRGKDYVYPISIQGAVYPLTVKWEAVRGTVQKLILMAGRGKDTKTLGVMEGSGKVTISDAGLTRLVVKLTEGAAIPKAFALSQNYPNPFNPVTHFSVEIPRASAVDLTVYDVLGRKIANIMTGDQEAGYHLMEWDSKDTHGLTVPSGMYMVRMTAGDFTAVRKIMLMK